MDKAAELCLLQDQVNNMILSRHRFYGFGNKSGLLVISIINTTTQTFIPQIITAQGFKYTKPDDIDCFREFYKSLYNLPESQCPLREDLIDQYLTRAGLAKSSLQARDSMEEPITAEVQSKAIKVMPTGKAPGLDGFPLYYCKTF